MLASPLPSPGAPTIEGITLEGYAGASATIDHFQSFGGSLNLSVLRMGGLPTG